MTSPLLSTLQSVLDRYPQMLWLSESEAPLEAVSLTRQEMRDYVKDPGDEQEGFYPALVSMCNAECEHTDCPCENKDDSCFYFYEDCPRNCTKSGWAKLESILDQPRFQSYRKPNGQPSEFELVVVSEECGGFVGLRTKIIET